MFRNSQSVEEKVKSGGGRKRTALQRTRGVTTALPLVVDVQEQPIS